MELVQDMVSPIKARLTGRWRGAIILLWAPGTLTLVLRLNVNSTGKLEFQITTELKIN